MRRIFRNLSLPALAVVVLGILVYRSRRAVAVGGFSWSLLAHLIGQARLSLVCLAVAILFLCYAVRALRWASFSRYIGNPTFRNVYSATLMGFTAVFLLGRAGEPVRPLLIARKDRLPVSGTFGVYVLERIFDAGTTVALFGLSLLLLPEEIRNADEDVLAAAHTAGIVLLAGLLLVVAFLVYFRLHGAGALGRRLSAWRGATGWRQRLAGAFVGFGEGLQAIRSLRDLLAGIGYSAVHWLLMAWIYLLLCRSFGDDLADLGFAGALMVLAVTMVGAMFQLPGVGGGSQVATFLVLTGIFGIEDEPAAAAAILIWLVTFASCSLAGVPLLLREGWSMRELWQLASPEKQAAVIAAHASPDVPVSGEGKVPR